ncbi:MAG: ABC transporter permease [Acidobacteria bacterium]|nr:MAG: ABC transporter permease [Acidobacteriota bacterium]
MKLWAWLRTVAAFIFRRSHVERELDEEFRSHLEICGADLKRQGLSRTEAERQARIDFGGYQRYKEECREAFGTRLLQELAQDLRHGLRQLRRNPGFTIVAAVTLALGIGATTAIFSVVNGVLLKPLPYPHPEQLVAVWLTAPGMNVNDLNPGPSDYLLFRDQNRTFQDVGLSTGYSVNVTGLGKPERVGSLKVTYDLLPALGATPMLGRSFTRADDAPGSPEVVMLTYGYWRRRLGADSSVIGKAITVDGKLREIIGVLPQSFLFGEPGLALLTPLQLDRAKTFLGDFAFDGIARLKPGVTLAEANADVARMLPIVLRSFPPPPGYTAKMFEDARIAPSLRPLKQEVIGDMGSVLWVLMGGIGLVLLTACANVANLLLVRVEGRRQELAIRAALGAGRGRIATQMLLEGFILALLGSSLGLLLADVVVRGLVAMAPSGLPRLNEITLDGTVVLFTLTVSLFVTLLIGLVPVLKYTGASLGIGLRESRRSMSESRQRLRSRSAMVTVQVAMALVLLVSSGLMIRTFRALTRVDPGFVAPAGIQTFRIDIPETQVQDPVRVVRMEQEILRRIRAVPGVSSAGLSMSVPMGGNEWSDNVFARDQAYAPGEMPLHRYRFATPGFIKTLGAPLIAGRDFTWSDMYNKVPVAIVSERLPREYWHDPKNAVGKQIRTTRKDDWREVIGVVGNIHDDGADKPAPSSVYWPILTTHLKGMDALVIRWPAVSIRSPRAGTESLMEEVRRAVWSVDSDLPLADVHTLDYYERASMARTSFTLVILAIAGGMALLLGIVGLYSVISYSVSQRIHEVGVRMALGSQKPDVLRLILRGGMSLAIIGLGIGITAALALTRFLSSLLYGVKPTDPLTFVAVSLILIVVALAACYIPARRAAKVDPMVALRYE